ncbi:hypothetical protein BH11ACT2_BH11ACT2_18460 [soil metagenome]
MTDSQAGPLTQKRAIGLPIFLIIAGLIGFWAAFTLVIEKLAVLSDPNASLSCNINPTITCGKNLMSWQGSLFGFPNPLIGIVCWGIVIVVAVSLLAGARFPRWYWLLFNLGFVFALAFVIFLIDQSIFSLGTLCIYCMVTWAVTIPSFLLVTLRNLRTYGRGGVKRFADALYSWVPVITLACYLVVAILAQLQLDIIGLLF